ncbi:unnamed protein product, partial [marine sediment metagenome]
YGFPDDDGQAYLAPRDCQRENLVLSALRADEVSNWLSQCRARRKLLVMDCCHAGGKALSVEGCSGERVIESLAAPAG